VIFVAPQWMPKSGKLWATWKYEANVIEPSSLHTFRHLFGACSMAIYSAFSWDFYVLDECLKMGSWEKDRYGKSSNSVSTG
jgi:hypothetical protein